MVSEAETRAAEAGVPAADAPKADVTAGRPATARAARTRAPGAAGGWFRRLWQGDEEALLAHYRRLSAEDLRVRFLHAVSDAFLGVQARRLRDPDYFVTGWFHDGVLRGVVEVAVDGSEAEAGFSVEEPWRNRGIGRALMRRALRRARHAGCDRLVVLTAHDNAPMVRLARAYGARIKTAGGVDDGATGSEVTGEVTLRRASCAELSFELAEDRIALLAAGVDALWSFFDANPFGQVARLLGRPRRPVGDAA